MGIGFFSHIDHLTLPQRFKDSEGGQGHGVDLLERDRRCAAVPHSADKGPAHL